MGRFTRKAMRANRQKDMEMASYHASARARRASQQVGFFNFLKNL